jgi:hypothetical protein
MSREKQPTGPALAWCPVPPRCTETGRSLTSNGWCPTPPVIVTKRNGHDISVGLVTKLHESGFYFYPCVQTDAGNFLPPVQWVSNVHFSEAKRPGREADNLPPSRAAVKEERSYASTPVFVFVAWRRNNSDVCINFADLILRNIFKSMKFKIWNLWPSGKW